MVGDSTFGIRRTPAIFSSLEHAIHSVRNNEHDMCENNSYQYAVIETTALDLIRPDLYIDTNKKWFKFNTVLQEFEPCLTQHIPLSLQRLSGFGIG